MNRGAEGTELLRTSLAAREARGGRHSATYCKAVLAERLAQLGSLDEALHLLNAATEQAERPGWEERCYLAGILRIKGELLAKNGDVEGAEINY
jgi:predicted negative regulator of RcsB-dependent stress response